MGTSLSEPLTLTHGYLKARSWAPCFLAYIWTIFLEWPNLLILNRTWMIYQVLLRISTHVCIRVPRISNLWQEGVAQESVVDKSSKDKACIVWHASTNLVPRVLSCPPYGASLSLSLSCYVGRVGENPGNEVARQLVSKLQHVTIPFLGQELTPLSSDKDLGIILDSNLPLSEHLSVLSTF